MAKSGTLVPRHRYLHRSANAGVLRNHKVVFAGNRIIVPVVAVAPGAPDTTFEVHGRVNPTLVLPAGAKVRFQLANADKGMPHGLDVTRKSPPYPENPHIPLNRMPTSASSGSKPSNGKETIISVGTIPKASDGRLPETQSAWTTLAPGVYYYVCPVPGHAKNGMHGKIIVRSSST